MTTKFLRTCAQRLVALGLTLALAVASAHAQSITSPKESSLAKPQSKRKDNGKPEVSDASPMLRQMTRMEWGQGARKLRPRNGTCPIVWVSGQEGSRSAVFRPGPMFPSRAGDEAYLDRVSGDTDRGLTLSLRDLRGRRGQIVLRPKNGERLDPYDIRLLLTAILLGDGEASVPPPAVGHSESRLLHDPYSNHLPPSNWQVAIANMDSALSAGWSKCKACHLQRAPVPDYIVERELGVQVEAQVRMRYMIDTDTDTQRRLRTAGEAALREWPHALKGYRYRFTAVASDEMNAFACPAGAIFVTTGMLESLESEDELRVLLAHEIAHVEFRHGLRQYQSAVTGSVIAGLVAGVMDAVTGTSVTSELVKISAHLALEIVLQGYSRDHEREADMIALSYERASGRGLENPTSRVFAKLFTIEASNQLQGGDHTAALLAGHPSLEERLERSLTPSFGVFDTSQVYEGISERGELMLSVTLRSQCLFSFRVPRAVAIHETERPARSITAPRPPASVALSKADPLARLRREYLLLATVELMDAGSVSQGPGYLVLLTDQGEVTLTRSDPIELTPFDPTGLSFQSEKVTALVGGIQGIRTPTTWGVARWRKKSWY